MPIIVICLVQVALTFMLFGYCYRKLIFDNLAMRQQITVYQRTIKRTLIKHSIKNRDRLFWIILSKILPSWKKNLLIVQPETVIKWHRKGFSLFWKWKTKYKRKIGRPKIPKEHIELIRRISRENPRWGEQKIADELELKLGIKHSTSTIRKYMCRILDPERGQRWRTFVKNHANEFFACDFLLQYTVTFQVYYIFVVMEIGSRRIVHINVTQYPYLEWVKLQIRQAIWDKLPRFLLHDNDGIFGQFGRRRTIIIDKEKGKEKTFRCVFDLWLYQMMGITGIPTPYRAPNANSHLERWNRSLREEALNHFIFFSENHIRNVIYEYVKYYNRARPSQAIHAIPDPYPDLSKPTSANGKIVAFPILGGLHHDYRIAA